MPAAPKAQVKKPNNVELELAQAREELEKLQAELAQAKAEGKNQREEFSGQGIPKNGNGMNRVFENTRTGTIRTVVDASDEQLVSLKNGNFVEITKRV